jgi:hypothetical protein
MIHEKFIMKISLLSIDGEELCENEDEYKKVLLVGNKVVNADELYDHLGVKRTFFIFVCV